MGNHAGSCRPSTAIATKSAKLEVRGAGAGTQTSIYSYDSIDNLAKVSVSGSAVATYEELFTHGGNGKPHALYNRTKSADPPTFFYDARGRLIAGDGRQYTYTSFDLPRSITTPAGTTQFKYDAFDSRVRKQGPSGVTTSIAGLYESHEGAGGFRYTFVVHGPDGPIAEILYKPSEPNPRSVHYRHHDALGSVSVTTVQGGSAIRRYYEPFGAHVGFDGSPAAPPVHDVRHGFTGHAHDDDLGLIDMRGRIYSPSTRQFLTPDPLGRLGASPYSYVRNNPINWIDPSGFTEEDPEGGWYSGFAGLFGSVPVAAIDMSPSLVSHVVASVAAMDFPNGNDAPNSSGIPAGTGAAPMACSMPGEAGCLPSSGPPTPEESYARYTTPVELSLTLPTSRGMTRERSPELEEAEHEYDALLLELTASATADAGLDYVRELRTDPATRDPFAQALWGPFAAKYEAERLRLGVDLLLQGGLGTLGVFVGGAVAAEAAAPRAYSVAFEARLTARGLGTYGAHFTEANGQLLRAMADPELAAALRQTLGANFEGSILSVSGRVLPKSPAGWTWHHVVDQPGVLQLVPQAQHASGSAWQALLHPGGRGRGGMFVWGSRY